MIGPLAAWSQKIDSIQTDEQALAFTQGLDSYKNAYITPTPRWFSDHSSDIQYIRRFGAKAFEKADFDGNGRTDLLFNGFLNSGRPPMLSLVILAYGRDSFQIHNITRGSGLDFFVAKKVMLDDTPAIEYLDSEHQKLEAQDHGSLRIRDSIEYHRDTIVYESETFVERTKSNSIILEQLRFCNMINQLGGEFSLIFYKDSVRLGHGEDLSPENLIERGGTFTTKLDTLTYKRMMSIIHHIDWDHLRTQYTPLVSTHAPTGWINITYNHGQKKQIYDVGLKGSYGLTALYDLFFGMLSTQAWEKVSDIDTWCDPWDERY